MEERGALYTCECLLETTLRACIRAAPFAWCAVRLRQATVATRLGATGRARALYRLVAHEAVAAGLPDVAEVAASRLASLAT